MSSHLQGSPKTKACLSICLIYLALVSVSCASPLDGPLPTPSGRGTPLPPTNYNGQYILIRLYSITVNRLPVDVLDGDRAQLEFFVFLTDGNLVSDRWEAFPQGYYDVRAGSVVQLHGASGPYFADELTSDTVYVWFLAVDSDEINQLVEWGVSNTIDYALDSFKEEVARRGGQVATRWNPWIWILGEAVDIVTDVWQTEDLIGQQVITLSSAENWNVGHYSGPSDDNGITLNYEVVRCSQEQVVPDNQEQGSGHAYFDDSGGDYPTRCAQSLTTRLHLNGRGRTILLVRLSESPTAVNGTSLAVGTDFRVIGGPVCAFSEGRPGNAQMLWWQVELLEGTARGRIGWIPESGLDRSGRLVYNVMPE